MLRRLPRAVCRATLPACLPVPVRFMSYLVNPNAEALRLYREILRTARVFTLPHPSGGTWGEVLAKSARVEFEAAKELDPSPEAVTRRIVVAHEALTQIHNQLAALQAKPPK